MNQVDWLEDQENQIFDLQIKVLNESHEKKRDSMLLSDALGLVRQSIRSKKFIKKDAIDFACEIIEYCTGHKFSIGKFMECVR